MDAMSVLDSVKLIAIDGIAAQFQIHIDSKSVLPARFDSDPRALPGYGIVFALLTDCQRFKLLIERGKAHDGDDSFYKHQCHDCGAARSAARTASLSR